MRNNLDLGWSAYFRRGYMSPVVMFAHFVLSFVPGRHIAGQYVPM